mmetsp:Transcript_15686/g.16961  ORF Transcript_15686/g.16961 Transcript_15686/m.16961 type:complete len:206 (-) Transcript_15686:189-806(-)
MFLLTITRLLLLLLLIMMMSSISVSTTTTTTTNLPLKMANKKNHAPLFFLSSTSRKTSTMISTLTSSSSSSSSSSLALNLMTLLEEDNNVNSIIFFLGLVPFAWATVEFWRRISVGESFGSGTDSIIISTTIGVDGSPTDSRGQRVLGKGALLTAYTIFIIAFATLGIVGYSILSSPPPSQEDLSTAAAPIIIENLPALSLSSSI